MAKTGNEELPGTAEGAALGRALHTRHAGQPVLADTWAVHLLSDDNRRKVEESSDERSMQMIEGFDASGVFAVNVGCLRYAEDEVLRCVEAGIKQYVILGAGLDSFALRRGDLAGRLKVFEVDHPDVQAIKRGRIEASAEMPAMLPVFLPVDFEVESFDLQLVAHGLEVDAPTVVSWLNTVHYLTEEAVASALAALSGILAAGSRLIVNYSADVPFSQVQLDYVMRLLEVTSSAGEPFVSRFTPGAFEKLLQEHGFEVVEHATEEELFARYFTGREDGLRPAIPLRVVTARKC